MAEELNKVLIVAYLDSSREASYDISAVLKEYGFDVDICHAQPEENEDGKTQVISKIKPDLYLTKYTDPATYKGIVFLDDGGHEVASKTLAKKANKIDLAIGGYGFGCKVLHDTGLLKDQFVCVGLSEDLTKKSKIVNSPTVRSENIVTCSGECSEGFAFLMVDALGGKVTKTVESESVSDIATLTSTAMVVAPLSQWSEYWSLAKELNDKHVKLIIADWNDIDVEKQYIKQCLAIGPNVKNKVTRVSACSIPHSVWFRQFLEPTIIADAVSSLESLGCRNINSSEAIKLANNKTAISQMLAGICYQGTAEVYNVASIDKAADILLKDGIKWVKAVNLERDPIKVIGQGQRAIVAQKDLTNLQMFDKEGLIATIKNRFAQDSFLIQEDLGGMISGDKTYELKFVMRKNASGWNPSVAIAASNEEKRTYLAEQFLKSLYPDWENKLKQATEAATTACIVFQSNLKNPNGVRELGVDVTFSKGQTNVITLTAMPELPILERTGMEKQAQLEQPRSEMATFLDSWQEEEEHFKIIKRELAHQEIWIQGDGQLALKDNNVIVKKTLPDALNILEADLKHYLEMFKEAHSANNRKAKRYAGLVRRAIFRLRLVRELKSLKKLGSVQMLLKVADYIFDKTEDQSGYSYDQGSVPGPWSNVRMPTRVIKWTEGDEWLEDIGGMDKQDVSNLARYHPDSKEGFYAEFDLWHRNDPTSWEEVEHGEGAYPSIMKYR